MTLRPWRAVLAATTLLTVSAPAAASDSSVKEAAKQFGHAVGSAAHAVGKVGAQTGRKVGIRAKHEAPPAWRTLQKNNHAFWQKRKAEMKKALGKSSGSPSSR